MLKKLLKNKKGLALESAVLFMVVIFSFCFLLSTLTITGHNRAKIEKAKIENDRNLDLLVEDYLAYVDKVIVPAAVTSAAPEVSSTPTDSSGDGAGESSSSSSESESASPSSSSSESVSPSEPESSTETAVSPPVEPESPENQSVAVEPVDISYEYPLLSPLDNTEGGNSSTESESSDSGTESSAEETVKPSTLKFEEYLMNNENTKLAAYDYENYSYISMVQENNGFMLFSFYVIHKSSNSTVLTMEVFKANIANGQWTTINFINKATQINNP